MFVETVHTIKDFPFHFEWTNETNELYIRKYSGKTDSYTDIKIINTNSNITPNEMIILINDIKLCKNCGRLVEQYDKKEICCEIPEIITYEEATNNGIISELERKEKNNFNKLLISKYKKELRKTQKKLDILRR